MKGSACARCAEPVERDTSFDTDKGPMCVRCFTDYAAEHQPEKKLDIKELKARKEMIEAETTGLLPRQILLGLIEDGYDRLMNGEGKFDQEVERLATDIQKMAGLAVARNVMNVLAALGKLVEEQEEEVRGTIRRLGTL